MLFSLFYSYLFVFGNCFSDFWLKNIFFLCFLSYWIILWLQCFKRLWAVPIEPYACAYNLKEISCHSSCTIFSTTMLYVCTFRFRLKSTSVYWNNVVTVRFRVVRVLFRQLVRVAPFRCTLFTSQLFWSVKVNDGFHTETPHNHRGFRSRVVVVRQLFQSVYPQFGCTAAQTENLRQLRQPVVAEILVHFQRIAHRSIEIC